MIICQTLLKSVDIKALFWYCSYMSFFKDLLLKKMLKNQLKGIPEDQQDKIISAVEKNPKLFADIAAEVQTKMKSGMDQQAATMEVMMKHKDALQELMK